MTACRTISPERRVSRPTTIGPVPMQVPKACAKRVSRIGVSDSPTTPRTPEIEIFSVGMARMIYVPSRSRAQSASSWARAAVARLRDYAHHRLGARRAHVHPSVRPVETQAVCLIQRCTARVFGSIAQGLQRRVDVARIHGNQPLDDRPSAAADPPATIPSRL